MRLGHPARGRMEGTWSSSRSSFPLPGCSGRSRAPCSSPGRTGRDILAEGSGNPGASNVARLLGWRAARSCSLLDFAKGALAAGRRPRDRRPARRVRARCRGGRRPHVPALPQGRQGRRGGAAAMLVVLYPLIVVGLGGRLVRRRARAAQGVARVAARARCCSRSRSALAGYDRWEVGGRRGARGARRAAPRGEHPTAVAARGDRSRRVRRTPVATQCARR